LGQVTSRAVVAKDGKRTAEKKGGAPTRAEARIAAAQRIALEMKYFLFKGLSCSR